jgi:site-specific DNA-methyltransferase (adenine-specific)
VSADATPQDVLEGRARWCVVEGEALTALRDLPAASIGALITDPPYSSGGFTRGDRTNDASVKYSQAEARPQATFGGDNRDQRAFEYWCVLWLSEALRCARPGAPVVQFTDWRQLPLTTDAVQAGGWVWRGVFVWSKGIGCRPQMGRFRSACEYGVWGTNGASEDRVDVGCLPGVIEASPPMGEDRVHLTQKPVEVMETVCAIAPPDSVVLDPFAGSGTTGVACLRLGRRFIGIERDARYAAIARERLAAESQGLTLRAARAGQLSLLGGP